jgi:NAD(P)H-hydrate repair Nnr-like enzyme with NAD(P)H-hydrate dehydratase domain
MKTLKFDRGDLVLSNGRFEYIEGKDKLGQLVGELLLISKLENGFGAGIVDALGSLDSGLVEVMIRDSIKEFARLQRSSFLYSRMNKAELIEGIRRLDVYVNKGNVAFELEVENQEKKTLEISGLI